MKRTTLYDLVILDNYVHLFNSDSYQDIEHYHPMKFPHVPSHSQLYLTAFQLELLDYVTH